MSPKPPKSVFETILEWSQGRPLWQRDALRRIVAHGRTSDADIAELVLICLGRPSVDGAPPSAQPLASAHLPASHNGPSSITISSISKVSGVNRLAAGQTLTFEESGLTVIYGDNGAGKSGYTRILKRVCRARARGEILPNAFDPSSSPGATATLGYSIGGVPSDPLEWSDDGDPHPILSAISVLDKDCAAIHVRNANEVAFRPLGLDVPDELAATCQAVKDALTAEQQRLKQAQDPAFGTPTFNPHTKVGLILSRLTAGTKLDQLRQLGILSPDEVARMQRLAEDLVRDPSKAAAEQRALATSLQRFAQQLESTLAIFGDSATSQVLAVAEDAHAKRKAATVAAETAFADSALPGIGEAPWKVLWEAARQFADQHVHPEHQFPSGPEGQVCVLCHQDLSPEAKSRMSGFEAFVKDKTETEAAAGERNLAASLAPYEGKPIHLVGFGLHHQVAGMEPQVARSIRRSLAVARVRRSLMMTFDPSKGQLQLPPLPPSPVDDLRNLAEKTAAYAQELEGASNAEGRKKLELELCELRDRAALKELLPKAEIEIGRLADLNRLDVCLKETATKAITTLGNTIADELITPTVRDRFQEEIQKLASSRVRVDIVRSGGRYGSPQYGVRLFANEKAKVSAVLSEGEQTCVAIAAFFTELATATHSSALVFDDPVSSLDHRWRRKVADRLVDEAQVRQVIVFTHDLVFLNDLETAAHEAQIPKRVVSLIHTGLGSGVVSDGLPWAGAKIPERLDLLGKEARAASMLYDAVDDEQYGEAAAKFYSRLRSTWERALEDVAFCGVLNRHRDYINAKNLQAVTALTQEDVAAWSAGFKKCCDQTDAHDPSRGRNAAPPPPEDLLGDLKDLSDWVSTLKARQKGLTSGPAVVGSALAPA